MDHRIEPLEVSASDGARYSDSTKNAAQPRTDEVWDLQFDRAVVRVVPLRATRRRLQSSDSSATDVSQRPQSSVPELKDALVRRFLAEYLRASPQQIVLGKDPLGRPTIEAIPGRPRSRRIDVSISHGVGVLTVGVSETARIGIDIEICESDFDFAAVMDSFFSPAERDFVRLLPNRKQPSAFFRIWTAKEAYVKAIGHGAAFGLAEVETKSVFSDTHAIDRVRGSRELAAGWTLTNRTLTIAERTAVLSVVTGAKASSNR